jgi:membrane-associated phospholipid phosphatase
VKISAHPWSALLCLVVGATPLPRSTAGAQAWRADADDAAPVFNVGFGLAAVLATTGLDRSIAKRVDMTRGPLRPASSFGRVAEMAGGRGPLFVAGLLVVGGFAGEDKRVERLGERMFRALAISYAMTGVLKVAVGRERPSGGNAHSFKLGRGLRHRYESFPSGHSSRAFTVATVLATGVTGASRSQRRAIGGIAYAAATTAAIARVTAAEHWVSDVIAGAAIGIVAGTWVTHRARRHIAEENGAGSGSSHAVTLLQVSFR